MVGGADQDARRPALGHGAAVEPDHPEGVRLGAAAREDEVFRAGGKEIRDLAACALHPLARLSPLLVDGRRISLHRLHCLEHGRARLRGQRSGRVVVEVDAVGGHGVSAAWRVLI
jgi:hypothetical protein